MTKTMNNSIFGFLYINTSTSACAIYENKIYLFDRIRKRT